MTKNKKPVANSRRLKVELFITPKMRKSGINEKINICNICGIVSFHDLSKKEIKKHFDSHTNAELLDKISSENPYLSGIKIIPDSAHSEEKTTQNLWYNQDDVLDKMFEKDASYDNMNCSSTMAWKEDESNNGKSKCDEINNV